MATNPAALLDSLVPLIAPEARERLLAQGLARGIVWRDGSLPEGAPNFPAGLTEDLLDFGYGVLAIALELTESDAATDPEARKTIAEGFRVAAEAIESAARRAALDQPLRGFHLLLAAAAFHLGGFPARSYSLISRGVAEEDLSSSEEAFSLLLRHRFYELRRYVMSVLDGAERSDERVAARLLDEHDSFNESDAGVIALSVLYHRSLGLLDTALIEGREAAYDLAISQLELVRGHAAELGNVPIWWLATLTLHLLRDLWDTSLHRRLPSGGGLPAAWNDIRRRYVELQSSGRRPRLTLWPSQLEAAKRAVDPEDDLVVALPTSAGKTRIAELCILRAIADGKRVVYVTPLRALSAQVERTLARTFVPLNASVTSLYGSAGVTLTDVHTLTDATIVVATPEKLDFATRQDPAVLDDVALVVFDEGHMIGIGSREIRYEVLIQRLLRRPDAATRRIVCLSAMFNPDDESVVDFAAWLRNDAAGDPVHVQWRPTRQLLATLEWFQSGSARLSFVEGEKPFVPRFIEEQPAKGKRKNAFPQNDIEFCIAAANAFAAEGDDVLVYSPQRRQVEPLVREFTKIAKQGYLNGVDAPDPKALRIAVAVGNEWLGEKHVAMSALRFGIGTHHGTLPRAFLAAIEDLLLRCQLRIVVASPTLAQGIDLACRVLLFRSIHRFDSKTELPVPIDAGEFSNVVGRAGRAFVDLDGIAAYPIFKTGLTARRLRRDFLGLVKQSRTLRLYSGLARLVLHIATELETRIGIKGEKAMLEYVLNHPAIWSEDIVKEGSIGETESDAEDEQTLNQYLSDLDVALFSLVDPLDVPTDDLADTLDFALTGSLWQRTLSHVAETERQLAETIIHSRAGWLWSHTTVTQRRACFNSGLGQRSGTFLYEHLDNLVDTLAKFQAGIAASSTEAAADAAVAFAAAVFEDPFFAPRKLPESWDEILRGWVVGKAFAAIAETADAHTFVQESIVFKLVWAAEAVRVQAIASDHSGASELGDGPAMSLTYGVSNTQAALLCQMGFASRVGALYVAEALAPTFTDTPSLRAWIGEHADLLADPEFWTSPDHHLLWTTRGTLSTEAPPVVWANKSFKVQVKWRSGVPPSPGHLRVVPTGGANASICSDDLQILGSCAIPKTTLQDTYIAGMSLADGNVELRRFGPD